MLDSIMHANAEDDPFAFGLPVTRLSRLSIFSRIPAL